MNKIYSLALAMTLLLSFGCGRGVEFRDDRVTPVDLAGKSLIEVLDIKYDRAEIKCGLWTQQNEKLDLTMAASDSFSVDLKSNPTLPRTVVLKGRKRSES